MQRLLRFLYCFAGLAIMAYTVLSFVFLYIEVPPVNISPKFLLIVMASLAYVALVSGLVIVLRGLLFHNKHHHQLTQDIHEDGIIVITEKALKNCVRSTVGTHSAVEEGAVKLKLHRHKGTYQYHVKVWLGIREGLRLDQLGETIRRHIATDLTHLTGIPAKRVDIVFYDLPAKKSEGDAAQ